MKRGLAQLAVFIVLGTLATYSAGVTWAAEGFPVFPALFKGDVTVAGLPAPDGIPIVARIADHNKLPTWESRPVITSNGRYLNLSVGPTDRGYIGGTVTFHAYAAQAQETGVFAELQLQQTTLDLTFPAIPPTPTPTPTPGPTSTLAPTPTIEVTATPRPTATALLPVPGDPSVGNISRGALAMGALLLLMGMTALRFIRGNA
jgi:hypothetical protein